MLSGSSAQKEKAAVRCGRNARWLGLVALVLAAVLVRWLTHSRLIYAWDTVHYLLAQERYDIAAHQPHPPGSFYYVLLARLLRPLAGDPHAALLWIAALSGGAMVPILHALGRELGGERAGWLAAVLGATAPLFWFYGSVGLNYGPAGALTALLALGLLRAISEGSAPTPAERARRRAGGALLAGGALGLLGGFRPTDVFFLLPAYLWALLALCRVDHGMPPAVRSGAGRRAAAASLLLAGALTLGWLLPNIAAAGGPAAYARCLAGQEHVTHRSSVFHAGWPALSEAVQTHRRTLEGALGAAWLPLGLLAILRLRRRVARPSKPVGGHGQAAALRPFLPPVSRLALLFIGPAFGFYLLVHFNAPGYALTYAGFLAALAAAWIAREREQETAPHASGGWRSGLLPAAVAFGNAALFLLGWPSLPFERPVAGQRTLAWPEIAGHDRYYRALRAFLEPRVSRTAEPVLVLASWNFTDGLRVAQALLPGQDVVQVVGRRPELPAPLRRLRWLRLVTPEEARAARDERGAAVYAIARTPEDAPYHRSLFPEGFDPIPIGRGELVLRLRSVSDFGRIPVQ